MSPIPAPARRGHPVTARLLALALGLLVAAGILAAVLAWQEREHRRREAANVVLPVHQPDGLKYAYKHRTDPARHRGWVHGLRAEPRRPGVRRVVAVGDSLTFGVGVDTGETWPAQLERALPGVEVFNFGMLGYDAEQVATLVECCLAAWRPDLVVWGNYTNDTAPTLVLFESKLDYVIYIGNRVPEGARLLPEAASLWLLRHSALFRRVQAEWISRRMRAGWKPVPEPGWYQRQLDRIAGWSARTGVPVLVLAIPDHTLAQPARCPELSSAQACALSEQAWREIVGPLEGTGLPWVDGQAAYAAAGLPHFFPSDNRSDLAHPNATGQRALAGAVAPRAAALLDRATP